MLPGGTSITHRDLPGVVGKQQGTALVHRMRHWGTLKATDFGNSDAAWPPGTPHGHQHWEWIRKRLLVGRMVDVGFFPAIRATHLPGGLHLLCSDL